MDLTTYLYKKIESEMRMIHIVDKKPKQNIRLDSIEPQDINIDLKVVQNWSPDNKELYQLILHNGMAEFICNRQFLNEFYQVLQFMYSGLTTINLAAKSLTNLKVLNLFHNNIHSFENIPPNCVELYLDYNQISSCPNKNKLKVEMLSLSHNCINDEIMGKILAKVPELRCLNVSHNKIADLKNFVENLKRRQKIKMLICNNNPISMLWLYWDYITQEIQLDFFDNQKYVKPEPQPPVQQKVVEEKKQQKKQDKKDSKNAKKGNKQQEKAPQPQPPKQIVKPQPRARLDEDYQKVKIKLDCGIFEGFNGIIYDSSIFPQQNLDIKKTQTNFWLEASLLNELISTKQNKISMDSVNEGQINRLEFQIKFQKLIQVNKFNMELFNQGFLLYVWKQQPKVETDAQSGEQKVIIQNEEIKMLDCCIGGVYVDTRCLHTVKDKKLQRNYPIFERQAIDSPLFQRPYENQSELIAKKRIQFDAQLARIQEEKIKKLEEQQAAKTQKKGGKDTKKAADKKGAKKQGKQPAIDKKNVAQSTYQVDKRDYCCLQKDKIFKALKNHFLSVKVALQ